MTKAAIVGAVGSDAREIGEQAAVHMDGAFRAMMKGPGVSQNESFLRLVTGLPHPMGNMALVSGPDDLSSTHAAIEPLLGCGAPAAAVFPRGASPRVVDAVRSSGFTIDASMPAMAVDIARMTGTALPDGYEFVRVGAGEEGRAWAEALATGYEIPRPLADMFSPDVLGADMAPDARTQFFAVLREGRQVATSMLHLADGLAGIYCVSTRPEERRQGLGGIATAEALRVAQQLGYRVGVLQSSPSGHPVYLRLGFGDYARVPMYVRVPG